MKYCTSHKSSNGQPSNGHETHETLNAALSAWEANIGSLIIGSGGSSDLTDEESGSIISWVEHVEGGFVTGSGDFQDEIESLSIYEEEDGETLTAEKLVKHLSE